MDGTAWFSADDRDALEDFWTVYDAHNDELVAVTLRALLESPELRGLLEHMPQDVLDQQNRESRERLRRAIQGEWAAYESNLRMQGTIYAKIGISFSDWYAIVTVFSREFVPFLVNTYGRTLPRLIAVLAVLQRFMDRSMAILGEVYIDTKSEALRESEKARAAVEARNQELEANAAKAALRESEERFRLLVAGVKDYAILMLDPAGRVASWNDGAERIIGYTADEIIGQDFARFFTPEDVAAGRPAEELAVAARDGRVRVERWRVRKDGSRFWANVVTTALRDEAGTLRGYSKVTGDFTARRLAEESLRESEERYRRTSQELEAQNERVLAASRLKSEFLANMSHELRTPLNAIIGFAELLRDGEVRPEMPQYGEFLGDILTSGRHLLQLINDVLDLSKVEAGRLEFHPEPVDLAEIAGEVLGILRTTAAVQGVRVEADIAPDLRDVVLDPARLKQVLYNYLSNALKFTPAGGRVTVHARAVSPEAFRVEVEDTGIGIAPADIGRLFGEFQQLDAGTAKKHAGTGLGLALTKRIVEAQHGTVGVRSVPGEGSAFYAVLPRRPTETGPRPVVLPRDHYRDEATAPAVLVIEDNPRDQAIIALALTDAGYAVETVPTGAAAVARCRERAFAAITVDLLLPDSSGLDVIRAIREHEPHRDVPIIVVTVVTERGAVVGFAVHDILPKPIERGALVRSLQRAGVSPGRSGSVLAIDDDAASLRLLSVTLAELGHDAVCLTDAAEALALAEKTPPAAVVVDLLMPRMDGFTFLDAFRRAPACRNVPVIVWTVKDLSPDEYARLRASAQAIVLKGRDDRATLLEELRTFLPPRPNPKGGA